jgi:hypothetical protein
MFCY